MFAHFDKQPHPITAAYLTANYDTEGLILNEALLAAVNSRAVELQWEVDRAIDEYCTAMATALAEIWDLEKFSKGPFFSGADPTPVPAAKMGSLSYGGWGISWVVRTDEYPHLNDLQQDVQEALVDRNRDLQGYIDSLR